MRHHSIFTVLLLLLYSSLYGQRIENLKAAASGDKVVITYDIASAREGQKFKVRVFSSHDNYLSPLSFVTGDVGANNELTAGSKRIEWDAKSELKDFDGNIIFEVRADVIASSEVVRNEPVNTVTTPAQTPPSVPKVTGPAVGTRYKRGGSLDIEWQGIPTSQIVKLELWKGGTMISPIGEISHRSTFPWAIPKDTKPGSDYQIRIVSGGTNAMSDNFSIRPKVPFLLKVLPVAVVGAVAYVVMSSGDKPKDDGGGGGTQPEALPEPPALPGN